MDSTKKLVFDPNHSELTFKVKHLMITNVKGEFKEFNVSHDGEKAVVEVFVDSISTNNPDRDSHLKSSDFFDVSLYPQIIFVSTEIEDDYVKGFLTIKENTKEVSFSVSKGIMKDAWGNMKVGYSLEGTINRSDFGLTWNALLESGGVTVSDEVKIFAEVQFVQQ